MLRSRTPMLVIFFALLLLAFPLVFSGGTEEVHRVIGVRHSGAVEAPGEPRTMIASYYGAELAGQPTASGEPFDPGEYTAAHRTLPLGARLLVSYGGESVRVTVNDRGPYVRGRDLDLSLAAARKIGITGHGSTPVKVSRL